MFCPKCGAQLPDGAKFCAKCGAQLADAQPAQQPNPQPAAWPAPGAQPAMSAVAASTSAGSKAPIVVIVAALAVIIAAGVFAWLMFFAPYDINEKNFPDATLRAAVAGSYDADHDGKLSRDEGKAVTEVNISGAGELTNLSKYFPNLEHVYAHGSSLTKVDLGGLSKLTEVDVSDSSVTELNVSRNGELTRIAATDSQITALDVSGNAKLQTLDVDDAVEVSGLDKIGMREVWVTSEIETSYEYNGSTNGSVTYSNTRDANGRLRSMDALDDDGDYGGDQTWDFERNDGPNWDWVTDYSLASGNSSDYVTFDRDDAGRVVSVKHSDYAYSYEYDDAGRVTKETYSYSGSSSDPSVTTYEYDANGRLSKRVNGAGSSSYSTTTLSYDDAGRLVSEGFTYTGNDGTTSTKPTENFAYDDAGHIVKVTYSGGDPEYSQYMGGGGNYAYDDQGRVTSATTDEDEYGHYEASFSYDDAGRLSHIEWGYVSKTSSSTSKMYYDISYERYFLRSDAPDPDAGFHVGVYYAGDSMGDGPRLVSTYMSIPDDPQVPYDTLNGNVYWNY